MMRARLTVESPLRIGGREQQVNKLEFVSEGGMLHVVSPTRLGELLLRRSPRALDDWTAEVLTRGQGAN
ncbi:MAG: hypothetical protein M3Q49_10195, partial [Actinomycetota bacterium]|nr:hypothetical protein [Actinomycetota bacterium]